MVGKDFRGLPMKSDEQNGSGLINSVMSYQSSPKNSTSGFELRELKKKLMGTENWKRSAKVNLH